MSINENSAYEGAVRSNGLIVYGGIAVAVIIALNVLIFTSGNYRQRGGPAKPLALQGKPFFTPPPKVKPLPTSIPMPTIVPVKGEKPEEKKAGKYLKLSFDRLAGFTYQPPHPRTNADERKDQMPEEITKLTGQRVQVEGYMVPLAGRNGLATRFILSRTAPVACCSTDSPQMDDSLKMNEWIGVIMEDGIGVPVNSRVPVTAYGTLEVGEKIVQGRVTILYRMKAEDVYVPPEL